MILLIMLTNTEDDHRRLLRKKPIYPRPFVNLPDNLGSMSLKQVPLHHIHQQLGAKIVPFAGYEMPVRYTSDLDEHHTVRTGVGVFDVSHMGEFIVKGDRALDLIQHVSANDASTLFDGKVQYSYLPNGRGGIVDDLLVYRISEVEYMLVVNASTSPTKPRPSKRASSGLPNSPTTSSTLMCSGSKKNRAFPGSLSASR